MPGPNERAGVTKRVRYHLDNLLARGTWAPLLVLGGISVLVVLVASALLAIFGVTLSGSEDGAWFEDLWQSLLRVLDSGTMANDTGWGPRFVALLVTVVGVLILGTLIGLIANGVEQRVDGLRRGRSAVLEADHIVIAGTSDRLPVIVRQLALAGRHRRGSNVIVVLADDRSDHLADELHAVISDLRGTRLVLRRGDPARRADLKRVGVADARFVVVLADDDAQGDAGAIKAVLAAGAELGGFDEVPIIVEIGDPETAATLAEACGGQVHPAAGLQAVARITAFALRESGLHQVVSELLDFNGADLYVRPAGETQGITFGESVTRFAKTRPFATMGPGGEVSVLPDPQTVLGPQDRLIVVADDDQPPEPAREGYQVPVGSTPAALSLQPVATEEHLLIIGWNPMGEQLLTQLGERAGPGSTIEIVYDPRLFRPEEIEVPDADNFTMTLTPSRASVWRWTDAQRAADLTAIVLLGYRRTLSVSEADSRTLLNLLVLRRQLAAFDGDAPRLIVELLDAENVDLTREGDADDFVISDAIVSRLIAQLGDQPARRPILLSLYAGGGPSVRLIPASDLGLSGEVTFGEVVATAYPSGLAAIGWFHGGGGRRQLALNPAVSERLVLDADDRIVVIG